jgi:tagatose 1,6-diphosphate aldolase GatY/KbaY
VGAFTLVDRETAAGGLVAAEEDNRVVRLVSAQIVSGREGRFLVPALRAMAEEARCAVCLQADHLRDREAVRTALGLGVGAVMADGSRLPWEENIDFTCWSVAEAARFGASVEGALGRIGGAEGDDDGLCEPSRATDAMGAGRFAAATRSDCLAVSIGNVHGTYRLRPLLDWARLRDIRGCVRTPLVLHGASGLAGEDMRRAVELGIAKVNVGTALRRAYLERTWRNLPSVMSGARVVTLHRAQRAAAHRLAAAVMADLSVGERCAA